LALQNGWNSDGAKKLRDFTQRVLEGKRYRISGASIWNDSYIQELLRY